MKCNYSIDDITNYIEGKLDWEKAQKIGHHLEVCDKCRKYQDSLTFTKKLPSEAVKPESDASGNLMNSTGRYNFGFERFLLRAKPVLKPAAAAVILCLFSLLVYRNWWYFQDFVVNMDKWTEKQAEMKSNAIAANNRASRQEGTLPKSVMGKDKLTAKESFTTSVRKSCKSKIGPGDEYEDSIELVYGTLLKIEGRYNGQNGLWFLARQVMPIKFTTENNSTDTVTQASSLPGNYEFWIKADEIDIHDGQEASFSSCSTNAAAGFRYIIPLLNSGSKVEVVHQLHVLPSKSSGMVGSVAEGSLLRVLRKDEKWSLVQRFKETESGETSDIGWIQNSEYLLYKPGMDSRQGFLCKPVKLFEAPDESSRLYPASTGAVAPVFITETKDSWIHVRSSAGIGGWVKAEALKYTLTAHETGSIMNPVIDKIQFAQKLRNEILNWEIIKLSADDINKDITLSDSQKSALAGKLALIDQPEYFDGGLMPLREAPYPFYTLRFLDDHEDDTSLDLNFYEFTVVGEDKLLLIIRPDKMDYYGLNPEGIPLRFIRVNKEFVSYIKALLPPPRNEDKSNWNYLLTAEKVIAGKEQGEQPQQVYKCARVLRSFAGSEIKAEDVPDDAIPVLSFEFIFDSGRSAKVEVTDKYILYNHHYYSPSMPTEQIAAQLFTGYF